MDLKLMYYFSLVGIKTAYWFLECVELQTGPHSVLTQSCLKAKLILFSYIITVLPHCKNIKNFHQWEVYSKRHPYLMILRFCLFQKTNKNHQDLLLFIIYYLLFTIYYLLWLFSNGKTYVVLLGTIYLTWVRF